MEFHERVIESVLVALVLAGSIVPGVVVWLAVGWFLSWIGSLARRKPAAAKVPAPLEKCETAVSAAPETPKSEVPKPEPPRPEARKAEAPKPEASNPETQKSEVREPPDPRAVLEDWAECVALDVIHLAAAGSPIAGRKFEPPPEAARLPRRESPPLLFLLRVPVAGLAYHAYGEETPRIARGTEVFLAREPANPHDALAIAVHGPGGRRIGYVPRRENTVPARLMDGGLKLRAFVLRHVIANGTPVVEIALALADIRREKGVAA